MNEVAGRGLAETVAEYSFAYLMTVTSEGRPHAVAVQPRLVDSVLRVEGLGSRSRSNIEAHPQVSLVWPPQDISGYSLIVDGAAGSEGETLLVTPGRAVLHRPGTSGGPADEGSACGSDCLPVHL